MNNLKVEIKKVNAEPLTGVVVTKARKVASNLGPVYQLELRQEFARQVTNAGGLLAIAMAGHQSFGKTTVTRVCWQNFSEEQIRSLNLPASLEQIAEAGTAGIVFPENPPVLSWIINGKATELKIVEKDTLTGREWKNAAGVPQKQQPKRAGQNGEILTYNGSPIYRNTELAVKGAGIDMSFEDDIITHNNVVTGSTLAARAAAGSAAAMNTAPEAQNSLGAAVLAVPAAGAPAAQQPAAQQPAGQPAKPAAAGK